MANRQGKSLTPKAKVPTPTKPKVTPKVDFATPSTSMGEHSGSRIGQLNQATAAPTPKGTVAPKLDAATLAYLNSIFGSEAAWVNDPELGPLILQVAKDGITDNARIKDYLMTHAVSSDGTIQTVPSDKSWLGTKGASVRNARIQQTTDPATYKQNVQYTLESSIIPSARRLGIKLDDATLSKIAEDVYKNGWSGSANLIDNAILSQYHYDPKAADAFSASGKSAGGEVSKTTSDFAQIAYDYGIPLPKDPAQMEEFIKSAVGPGGSEQSFTDYAKAQAKIQFPWMAASIDAGVTPKAWLTPIATQIGNTLDIPASQIDWTDPKWQGVLSTPDAKNPGIHTPNNINTILTKVKNDPAFGYDYTQGAKNDAYALGASIRQMMGYGA